MKFDYQFFLRRYMAIEENFLQLTDFIEPEENFNSHCYQFGSSKLMDFCLKVGTEIETLFRLLLEDKKFDNIKDIENKRKSQNMDIYREVVGKKYKLHEYKLRVHHIKKEIYPFENFDKKNPDWFRCYSKHKHDKIKLIKIWNLKYALFSLGCLLLLVINHPEVDEAIFHINKINSRVFHLMNSEPRFVFAIFEKTRPIQKGDELKIRNYPKNINL